MPKKIDWEPIKEAYINSDESLASLALRFGVSKRALEGEAAAQSWKALKDAKKLAGLPVKAKEQKNAIARSGTSRRTTSALDEIEILETAIADMSAALVLAETKSKEGCASALAKLLELRRKLVPTTAEEIADQCMTLGISPEDFIDALRQQWQERA